MTGGIEEERDVGNKGNIEGAEEFEGVLKRCVDETDPEVEINFSNYEAEIFDMVANAKGQCEEKTVQKTK